MNINYILKAIQDNNDEYFLINKETYKELSKYSNQTFIKQIWGIWLINIKNKVLIKPYIKKIKILIIK